MQKEERVIPRNEVGLISDGIDVRLFWAEADDENNVPVSHVFLAAVALRWSRDPDWVMEMVKWFKDDMEARGKQ